MDAAGPDRERRLDEALREFTTPGRAAATARDGALLARGEALGPVGGLAATAWGAGPSVLLVHGWNSRGTHWGAFVEALTAAGFRAVAIDAPGHGDSPGESCHVVELGRRLVEVGRHLGPLAGVVAHSFGAGAAVLALGRGLRADRAALLAGPASLAGVVERWGRAHGLAEADLPAFLGRVERFVGEPVADLDLIRVAAGLDVPALIVHDRDDDEVPPDDARALADAWPGARLLPTERYGHRRILVARPVVAAVAEFLAGRPA